MTQSVPAVDWAAHARRLTAARGGCTTDGAMLARRAAWERREQILWLKHKAEVKTMKPFTFRAKRPFHPERLFACLSRGQTSRCSLRGIAWLASRNDEQATVLHPPDTQLGSASTVVSIVRGPPWWASIDREEWPDGLESDLLGTPLWCETYGDRQVEICVSSSATAQTTPQLDGKSIEAELASCLLTDSELEAGVDVWDELNDPFLDKEQSAPFSFAAGVPKQSRFCRPCAIQEDVDCS